MPVLWLRLSEDASLPSSLSPRSREQVEAVFDYRNKASPWCGAARSLGLPVALPIDSLIRWQDHTPYIHWSAVVGTVSQGRISVVPDSEQGFSYQAERRLSRLPGLVRSQWSIEQFLHRTLSAPLPGSGQLQESLALGLAALALMLRLPRHSQLELARWLSSPEAAPARVRRTVRLLQKIQHRRTQLSRAWREVFAEGVDHATLLEAPRFFWEGVSADHPSSARASADVSVGSVAALANVRDWQGLPVSPGSVTGAGLLIAPLAADPSVWKLARRGRPRILIFLQARPEAVEYFGDADAALFAEGGVLSHACVVARERSLPCVTGLGRDFIHALKARSGFPRSDREVLVSLDGATGLVRFLE